MRIQGWVNANFIEADLLRADLRGADLSGAVFGWTNLSGADLAGANFAGALLSKTILADVDLSKVKGLETVTHEGPSTIGIDTIYRSQGKIPETFLRGAGVSDDFIALVKGIAGSIQFYSCFISYSAKDQEFADRLYEDLQSNGVRCWFASHDIQAGKKLHEQIGMAISLHERLLLILSPNSIKSEWVKTEIAKARKREVREDQQVLFPISLNVPYHELQEWECFDADTGKGSAREIREYYIPDFTKWKDHDSFQKEFKKLLQAFKKADEADGARAKSGG